MEVDKFADQLKEENWPKKVSGKLLLDLNF